MQTANAISAGFQRVIRSVDELSPDAAHLAAAAGASEFYYGLDFLRAYENEPIQRVHDVYYIEVNDADDGSYDHMEQLHVTLHYAADPALEQVGADSLWSGDDVSNWAVEVEAAEPFGLLRARAPIQIRVDQYEV